MPGRRYFLRCEGASQVATVRVNGVDVGTHKGAFTAFCFEVTDALKSAGNKLEIEVSNEYDPAIPPASGDFSMCGGLYRSVWLVETDPVCIDPTIDGASGVRVFAETNGMVRVEADVSGADDATIDWSPKSIASPILWSPETPQLYTVRVTVRKGEWSDAVEETFGFRTAELRADGFYLNGVKRKVRGVNRHQDLAGMGWEVSPAQEERDVRLIRAMGADGARLCHYPQSRTFLDACDKHGLMVWSEIPVVDRISSDTAFTENALTMLREMIAQRRNHPSVCWWGMWNELYNNCERQGDGHLVPEEDVWVEPVAKLVAEAKAQDPSRPVVAASNMLWRRKLNALQYVCLNTYPGWYFEGSMKATVGDLSLSGQIAISIPDNAQVPAGGMVLLQPTGTLSVASGTTFVVEGGVGGRNRWRGPRRRGRSRPAAHGPRDFFVHPRRSWQQAAEPALTRSKGKVRRFTGRISWS